MVHLFSLFKVNNQTIPLHIFMFLILSYFHAPKAVNHIIFNFSIKPFYLPICPLKNIEKGKNTDMIRNSREVMGLISNVWITDKLKSWQKVWIFFI